MFIVQQQLSVDASEPGITSEIYLFLIFIWMRRDEDPLWMENQTGWEVLRFILVKLLSHLHLSFAVSQTINSTHLWRLEQTEWAISIRKAKGGIHCCFVGLHSSPNYMINKYSPFFLSKEERKSQGFKITWGWVHFNFWFYYPFNFCINSGLAHLTELTHMLPKILSQSRAVIKMINNLKICSYAFKSISFIFQVFSPSLSLFDLCLQKRVITV